MCGIVGYIGKRDAVPVLIKGLSALEYRGYDSAGIAVQKSDGDVRLIKRSGKVSVLAQAVESEKLKGFVGIGHTRWATHGKPNEVNAHPHRCGIDRVFVVHNGIIENAQELKIYLKERGHKFLSETDTEVLPHLISERLKRGASFKDAFMSALSKIEGAYAFAVMDAENPNKLYVGRLSSPLVIGVGDGENYIASDPSVFINKTKSVVYLKDNEVACVSKDDVKIVNLKGDDIDVEFTKLDWEFKRAKKDEFKHFMLKEIFEAPSVVRSVMQGRIQSNSSEVCLGGLTDVSKRLKQMRRLMILGCGTSYYAGLVGEYFLEDIACIPTRVHIASEFRYKNCAIDECTVAIVISQSGETADTLAGLKKVKSCNVLTLGVVNTVGSSIARETDAGVHCRAGQEIGVASTKAFLSQLTVLLLLSLYLSSNEDRRCELLKELENIPKKIQSILDRSHEIKEIAKKYQDSKSVMYIGRGYNYPVALEGALKLKEISYIHAEGFAAGELKHGPIAMIDEYTPTVAIATNNAVSKKMISNLEEIRARHGSIFAVATVGDVKIEQTVNDVFYIPSTLEPLEPLLTIIPLQLFAYYIGVGKGLDVDMPRNLAKSVTVE